MLTQEQIKNLKKGQEVYIKANFLEIGKSMNESLYVHINRTDGLGYGFEVMGQSCNIPIEDIVIPSSPKHDPCRQFREGDVVRFRKVNGNNARCRYNGVEIKEGSLGRIVKEEGRNCFWVKFDVHHNWCLDAAYFELITPVEELEPYSVKETMSHDGWQIVRDGLPLVIYDSRRHPNAKAAAKAERDRLNDEWRKEQNNG